MFFEKIKLTFELSIVYNVCIIPSNLKEIV